MSNLSDKLKKYGKTAAVLLSSSSVSNAAVIYTDITDVTLNTDGAFYNVDLDNNSTLDFRFNQHFRTSSNSVGLQNLQAGNSFIGTAADRYASVLGTGANVSAGANWMSSTNTAGYALGWYRTSAWGGGSWAGQANKFIGVKLNIAGVNHYGWIRVTVNSNMSSITIHDYAYEECGNEPINTGANSGGAVCLNPPIANNVGICQPGQITFNATPSGGNDCRWYETSTSTSPIATGLSYSINIAADTFFYVSTTNGVDESVNRTKVFGRISTEPITEPVVFQVGNNLSTYDFYAQYQWHLDNAPIAGANAYTYRASQKGAYHVTVVDTFACDGFSLLVEVDTIYPNGIREELNKVIKVYPNPSKDRVYVENKDKSTEEVQLFDMMGRLMYINNDLSNKELLTINVADFPKGTYFLKIYTTKGEILKKVIVE